MRARAPRPPPRRGTVAAALRRDRVKLEGTFSIGAPRAIVWELLNDPAVLARIIPGCERLTPAGSDRYQATITAGVAAVKGTYAGIVAIREIKPPESYTLEIDGKGTGGFVRGRGTVSLAQRGLATDVSVDGDAQIGGPIAGIGQRLIGGAARMMLGEFFRALNEEAQRRMQSSEGLS